MTLPRIARSRAGFTLTELIVALVLMAATVGIIMPAVNRTLNEGKINQASTVVVSTLRESGSLAARRRRPIRVSVHPAERAIRLRDDLTPDSIFRTLWLNGSSELAVSSLASSATQVVVYPNGLRSNALNVTIQIGDDQRQVTMTRAGQIRISTP